MKSVELDVPEDERELSCDRARRYYQLALRYAVAGSEPLVIVVMGRVGTGKSTLAELLARSLGWNILSSDRVRKEYAGVALYERGTDSQRARLYSQSKTSTTYSILCREACEHSISHRGIVLDATYGKRRHRDELRLVLKDKHIPCYFVEVKASPEIVKERLMQRETGSKIMSDARLEDFDSLNENFEEPDDLEDANHFFVESGSKQEQTLLDALLHVARHSIPCG